MDRVVVTTGNYDLFCLRGVVSVRGLNLARFLPLFRDGRHGRHSARQFLHGYRKQHSSRSRRGGPGTGDHF